MKILIYFAVFRERQSITGEICFRQVARPWVQVRGGAGKQMSAPAWNVKLMTHDSSTRFASLYLFVFFLNSPGTASSASGWQMTWRGKMGCVNFPNLWPRCEQSFVIIWKACQAVACLRTAIWMAPLSRSFSTWGGNELRQNHFWEFQNDHASNLKKIPPSRNCITHKKRGSAKSITKVDSVGQKGGHSPKRVYSFTLTDSPLRRRLSRKSARRKYSSKFISRQPDEK